MRNAVYLIGRLTKDIECRTNENGGKVATFTLAVTRSYKNAQGEYDTDFINCIGFAQMAEYASKYTKKGDLVAIAGRIQNRTYEKDGEKKTITDIVTDKMVFLASPKETEKKTTSIKQEEIEITDDDLPF